MSNHFCPFCDFESRKLDFLLEETESFRIIADTHPLCEGHILIIPKDHISCVGEYTDELFEEFNSIYQKVQSFIKKEYGKVSTFEHGKIGQFVFHSHMHILPFDGEPDEIIIEGVENIKLIKSVSELKNIFQKDGQYLFFSIEVNNWIVNTDLGFPRFFRDRFAEAMNAPRRKDWKQMSQNKDLMAEAKAENEGLLERWYNE